MYKNIWKHQFSDSWTSGEGNYC